MKIRALAFSALVVLHSATAFAQQDPGRFARGQGVPGASIKPGKTDAKMDNKPYSGSYLPRSSGPLARENDSEVKDMITKGFGDCDLVHQIIKDNANKPTTEKFDTAVKNTEGTDPHLTSDYNRDGYNPNAQGWEGFCHLWSPAGLDPISAFVVSMDKIYANVPFGIGDLKELTTYNYPQPYTKFIGKRNNNPTEPEAEADVLDPVDLLATFQAYVGPGKPGVVLDIDPGPQVWNQPFYSYSTETTELTGDAANGGPRGTKAYTVKLGAQYASEGSYAYRGETYLRDLSWNMKVWVDARGNVKQAEWVKEGSDRIPDFAWVPVGKNTSPNFERLQKIAKEGVSVKDIESFCKGMQALTADGLKNGDAKKLADLLNAICPVLDQNKLSDYIGKTAARLGVDGSALDSALNPLPNS